MEMSKRFLALAVLFMMLFTVGCNGGNNNANDGNSDENNGANTENGSDTGNGVEERNADGEFFYRGIVTAVDNKYYIAMEIVDSNVAFGVYHVLVGDQTVFINSDGATISRDQIKVGDTIEVVFSGQVMLSMPPQIAAQKIILK